MSGKTADAGVDKTKVTTQDTTDRFYSACAAGDKYLTTPACICGDASKAASYIDLGTQGTCETGGTGGKWAAASALATYEAKAEFTAKVPSDCAKTEDYVDTAKPVCTKAKQAFEVGTCTALVANLKDDNAGAIVCDGVKKNFSSTVAVADAGRMLAAQGPRALSSVADRTVTLSYTVTLTGDKATTLTAAIETALVALDDATISAAIVKAVGAEVAKDGDLAGMVVTKVTSTFKEDKKDEDSDKKGSSSALRSGAIGIVALLVAAVVIG